MSQILLPILIVGFIGIITGLCLSFTSIVMDVPKNKKVESILAELPGANCGACGYSGCEGYAAALSEGNAIIGLCTPGGSETSNKISKILGISNQTIEKKFAVVNCIGNKKNRSNDAEYNGINSCIAASQLCGGMSSCFYGCLGFGDCMKSCEFGAINIIDGIAVINPNLCKSCGKCISICPKKLINYIPVQNQAIVLCNNCSNASDTIKSCSIGCIACAKCVNVCEFNAIKIENFCAIIDPTKCTACAKCVEICPRNIISLFN